MRNPAFLHMRKHRCRSAVSLFHYIDSTISLLPKSEISSPQPSSMAVQLGLCGKPEDRFSHNEANMSFDLM